MLAYRIRRIGMIRNKLRCRILYHLGKSHRVVALMALA
jgi:hypothetical protein